MRARLRWWWGGVAGRRRGVRARVEYRPALSRGRAAMMPDRRGGAGARRLRHQAAVHGAFERNWRVT
ncbi:hypothetical protein SCOCK_40118 [Actinacidiphila cocklensis]|uniref:Uncharacterized protein n=1 Tax=Actinacidiphila cocklensis TaxID=887465 RepID=A0A9W4DU34_9ACTN|nr:hypothetical protein SCOCK_40118 [Actinacidiphila cocklensis]